MTDINICMYEKQNWLRYCVDAVKLRNKLSHKKETFLSSHENDIDREIYCNMHEVNFLNPSIFVVSNFHAAYFEINFFLFYFLLLRWNGKGRGTFECLINLAKFFDV